MTSTCIHGFAPGTCLICQTLDGPGAPPATKATKATKATTGPPPARRAPAATPATPANSRRAAKAAGASAIESTGPRVLPSDGHGPRSAVGLKLIGLVIAVAIVLALAWTAFHLIFAVLHIVELVAVAVVAGYVAWKAGVHHGRRTAPPKTR